MTLQNLNPTPVHQPPKIAEIIQLDRLDENRFITRYHASAGRRGLFGGQILSQGLMAAAQTVNAQRAPSELKILFLLSGIPDIPVVYTVDTLLEGGSFSIRRVRAEQGSRLIADITASFQKSETGYEHQEDMPAGIRPPEELPDIGALAAEHRDRLPPEAIDSLTRAMPVDLRPVHPEEFMMRPSPKPEFWYWAKSSTGLPDDPIAHYGALSFISDWWFSASGNMSHVDQVISTSYFVTSLNHTVWFHRRLRADDWLLFCSQSPSAHGARSLCLGKVWDRQGRRVASLAQEVLGRQRS